MFRKFSAYLLIITLGIIFLPSAFILAEMNSVHYKIWADDFSSGGTENSSSTNYGIQDTIGETIILSATSTSANYGIKAGFREMYPDKYITFSLGTPSVSFGTLSTSETKTASHTMTIDTNADNGFTITVAGSTLTKGSDTVSAIGAAAAVSTPGTAQFGLNLVANTTPAVGAGPVGTAPLGAPAGVYGTANQFAFNSGDTVASAASLVKATVFTVSYIANISSAVPAGDYATTLTYAATANY